MGTIDITGARERNLKNITVSIPKKKITLFTGVSGSGKSSLVFDTIAAESQRQLNASYTSFIRHRLPHYGQPAVDRIEHLPVSFIINQKRLGSNSRSTVGTVTDIYASLRLLYSRMGEPFTGYAEAFSFNNPKGMCEECQGTGKVDRINIKRLLDRKKSLNEGAILFPGFETTSWRIGRYTHSGLFDNDKKIKDFTEKEMHLLLYADNYKLKNPSPEFPKTAIYEGIIPRIERSFLKKESNTYKRHKKQIDTIISREACPQCGGSRLNETIRACKIRERSIADCCGMQLDDLLGFINELQNPAVDTVLTVIREQLQQMIAIGLGYLSLNRDTPTLSGGESQRIKMVQQLGSSLCDVMYIFDEPSIGLHPYNVDKINDLLRLLRDKGNTVLVVEHDPDIIKIADHIIDMGPNAGSHGGEIVFQGPWTELLKSDTLTSLCLNRPVSLKKNVRKAAGYLSVKDASLNNLKHVSVDIPTGVFTCVTGVAGSGKSSLINGVLPDFYPDSIFIDQKGIQASKRSNLLTFTGIFDEMRRRFAAANNVKASLFSFNSEGACPVCKGLGVVYTDLAFLDTVSNVCEACEGRRYIPEILQYRLNGKAISDMLAMPVEEAYAFFQNSSLDNDDKKYDNKDSKEDAILTVLQRLLDVGLGYITLGQSLDTLSGGELQRVKLAAELESQSNLYILDEPTTGLHLSDISQLLKVLNRLVDNGNTLIVIEHNLEVIAKSDWVIDMGPGAGHEGGNILFEGTPQDLLQAENSITGKYLRQYIA